MDTQHNVSKQAGVVRLPWRREGRWGDGDRRHRAKHGWDRTYVFL